MKKNSFLIGISMLIIGITGCSVDTHEHTFSTEWTTSESGHWHAATCEHTTEKEDWAPHSFKVISTKDPTFTAEGEKIEECSVCKFKKTSIIEKKSTEGYSLIPAGTFRMGSEDFGEIHNVTLTRDFLMCDHEVTNEEYTTVMDPIAKKSSKKIEIRPSYHLDFNNPETKKYPVEGVCWSHAVAYCQALSIKDGLTPCYKTPDGKTAPEELYFEHIILCDFDADGYRLPTEAEWEYAARAGDNRTWPFVSGFTEDTNQNLYTDAMFAVIGRTHPEPVKSLIPNAFNLYDMSGNVSEWVYDYTYNLVFGNNNTPRLLDYKADDVTDPVVEYSEEIFNSEYKVDKYGHIIRGGFFRSTIAGAYGINVSDRLNVNNYVSSDESQGFRVVRTIKK